MDWVTINFDIRRSSLRWESRDKFILCYMDAHVKKNDHIVHIGTPDYRTMQVNVQVVSLDSTVHPYIYDISLDKLGRNYAVFWSKSENDQNYSCSYYKVNSKNKTIENKLSHTLLQCGFKDIEWSRIENLFYFKMRSQI
jgi:hypothetical protein